MAGDELTEYQTGTRTYSATQGNGTLSSTTLTWDDTPFVDENGNEAGLLPSADYFVLKADTKGYQNIEVSFDLGFYDEDYDKTACTIFMYSNNYTQMKEYYPREFSSSNKLNHYKISFKGEYIELENDTYNELYFQLDSKKISINNIVVTGTKIDETNGRKYVYGDANEDEIVSIADCTLLQKYLAGIGDEYIIGSPYCYCKVNDDLELSISDITCIQKYLAGYTDGCGKTGNLKPL